MSATVQTLTVLTAEEPYTVNVPADHHLDVQVTDGTLVVQLLREEPCGEAHPMFSHLTGRVTGTEAEVHTHPKLVSIRFFAAGYWQYTYGEETP